MPLGPDEICAVYYAEYRAGLWKQVDKPLVQKELQHRCWQAVLDAVRAERQSEIDALNRTIEDLQAVVITAAEANATA